jgi:ureidoglycolate hydrolase
MYSIFFLPMKTVVFVVVLARSQEAGEPAALITSAACTKG